MKTPTWGTVIGIIMIVFGGCGAMNDIRSISMPEKLAEERGRIKIKRAEKEDSKQDTTTVVTITDNDSTSTASTDSLSNDSDTDEEEDVAEIPFFGKKSPEEMISISDFSATWIVRFGYIGAIVSVIYLLGGVFLLVRKTFSIKLAYAALVISILCAGAQTAILTSNASGDFIPMVTGLSQLPGILIDIVLLAVVFSSEKEAYLEENLSR